MTADVVVIEKANITVTPPGEPVKFALLSGSGNQRQQTAAEALPAIQRRGDLDVYYGMYTQHPIVRSAIDKKARVAVANGFRFLPEDQSLPLDRAKAKELRKFFRSSAGAQLLRNTFQDLQIFGEAYWWLDRPKVGKPRKAMRLHPKYVDVYMQDGVVVGYRYGAVTGSYQKYDLKDVVQFKIDDPSSDIHGLSPLASLERTVSTDLFAMAFNQGFFENSAQTGIIFMLKSGSEAEIRRNRAWLEENYVGSKNAHRPLLLEGDVEVAKSVSEPADMQYEAGRLLNRSEILAVLDVPPERLGIHDHSAARATQESAKVFRADSIAPLQLVVEEEINNSIILGLFGYDDILIKFNEIDAESEMANLILITEAETKGLLNVNEGRARLGYGEVEGGDMPFIQTAAGLIPLHLLEAFAQATLKSIEAMETNGGLQPKMDRLSGRPMAQNTQGVGADEKSKDGSPTKGK